MNLTEIHIASRKIFNEFTDGCRIIPDEKFFFQPADKWSVAQNVDHLIRSMKPTRLVYILPKFIVRLYTGTPNRPSRSYEALVEKYKTKLAAGGRATGIFIPKPVTGISKDELLARWDMCCKNYLQALAKNRDEQLDRYLAPHPLLGKITLRELCYFTIYHTAHHLNIIKQRNQ
jgi:hypothetical protein